MLFLRVCCKICGMNELATRLSKTTIIMGLDVLHVKPTLKTDENLQYFTLEEFKDFPEFLENHKNLITTIDNEDGSQTHVIYYIEKGYQRKQMAYNFTDIFENEKLYFDITIVKDAKRFLKAQPEDEQYELENAFQLNFIDNFVEGESIFFISW